jgi:uncharacterized protein YcbK (DUF882 family)
MSSRQSSTADQPESTGDERQGANATADAPLELPRERRHPWWDRPGVTPRVERILDGVGVLVVALFAIGWTWSIALARTQPPGMATSGGTVAGGDVASALTNANAPTTAYLTDATLNAIVDRMFTTARGRSGKLKAEFQPAPTGITPDTLPPGGQLKYSQGGGPLTTQPKGAGVWSVALAVGNAIRPVANFNLISMLPFSAKKNGHVGLYYLGTWPSEKGTVGPGKAPSGAYASPRGFIEVTEKNADTRVSEHFKLRDFLTHDQPTVWPKYLVLQPKLIDKLELVLADLQAHGIDTRGVRVMSGFRTPQYNYTGGNTGGRASLSRHMYGDASDIFIDNDGDGQMDDLNHDGKITIDDSRVVEAAVDRVDAKHPELIGGAGVYTAGPGHGPFIHIDTRGYRARWVGTSGG